MVRACHSPDRAFRNETPGQRVAPNRMPAKQISTSLQPADDFPQKPGTAFRLIDPIFNQAGCRHVIVFFTDFMRGPQKFREIAVIGMDLAKHVFRTDRLLVVILQPLMLCDVADGVQRSPAEFAGAFGNIVGHVEDLFALLVEQKMVIAKMAPGHVPMKILRLDVQRKCVREQRPKLGSEFRHTFGSETARYFVSVISFCLGSSCACAVLCHEQHLLPSSLPWMPGRFTWVARNTGFANAKPVELARLPTTPRCRT